MIATPITPERLSEIAALCEAATPGPWVEEFFYRDGDELTKPTRWRIFLVGHANPRTNSRDCDWTVHDARFIAVSRAAIPELLAEVTRLQAHEAQLLETVRTVGDNWVAACRERDEARDEAKHLDAWEDVHIQALANAHARIAALETDLTAARVSVENLEGMERATRALNLAASRSVIADHERIAALETGLREACNWIADRSSDESLLVDRLRAIADGVQSQGATCTDATKTT